MKTRSKNSALPEWATQVTALRVSLKINQAELARTLECSAMTVSRWERGLLQPSAQHFIQLGNMGSKEEAWPEKSRAGVAGLIKRASPRCRLRDPARHST